MSGGGAAPPDAWGIVPAYEDAFGRWTEVPDATRAALVEAMGGDPAADGPPTTDDVHVLRNGRCHPFHGAREVVLEDGTTRSVRDHLPAELPPGYHELHVAGEELPRSLILSPGRCHLPPELRTWGWAAQLYALRSSRSWGMGDLGDLEELARWSAGLGAGTLLVNPLFSADPLTPRETSPYFPTSRRFLDPVYLRIEDVPGAEEVELDDLLPRVRGQHQGREIDRDAVYAAKMEALERIWERVGARVAAAPELARFRADRGPDLYRFGLHQTLTEHHASQWPSWPQEHRRPDGAGIAAFADAHADRIAFHCWVQWLLDRQLRRAGAPLALLGDLPIGADPQGADAWMWQDVLAPGVSVGAPPDRLGPQGQDWSLPAFVPWKLRAAGYRPFVETARAALRHVGGVRIDHVLGLFRLFWIPPGASPAEGAYVRQPANDLLDILALESQRAGAFVVGEDLGTVEAGVRDELAARGILRYQVWWFEEDPVEDWARDALASVATHDLPTVAGVWTGADARMQAEHGLEPDDEWHGELRSRIRAATGLSADADPAAVVRALHARLGEAPNRLVVAQLEDALGMVERPNVPGTTREQRANWSLALPVTLEQLQQHGEVRDVAAAVQR